MGEKKSQKGVRKLGRYQINLNWDRIYQEIEVLQKSKTIVFEELKEEGLYTQSYQSFFRMYHLIKKERGGQDKNSNKKIISTAVEVGSESSPPTPPGAPKERDIAAEEQAENSAEDIIKNKFNL